MQRDYAFFAGLVLTCISSTVAVGVNDDLIAAAAAERKGDYTLALNLIRPLAEQGDGDALFALGELYALGHGVPQDWVKTEELYRKGVAGYRVAALRGDAYAQFRLGVRYERGEGTPKDFIQAVQWYRKAAQQDYPVAQQTLGSMYEEGKGVPQDYVLAYMWYNLAAAKNFGVSKELRSVLSEKMTREQIAEVQKIARDWKPSERTK